MIATVFGLRYRKLVDTDASALLVARALTFSNIAWPRRPLSYQSSTGSTSGDCCESVLRVHAACDGYPARGRPLVRVAQRAAVSRAQLGTPRILSALDRAPVFLVTMARRTKHGYVRAKQGVALPDCFLQA